jgi:hypothetical protein
VRQTQFSVKNNEKFINDVINQDLLDCAVVWISDNFVPEDVFDKKVLEDWAFENGFRKFE